MTSRLVDWLEFACLITGVGVDYWHRRDVAELNRWCCWPAGHDGPCLGEWDSWSEPS